MLYSAVIAVLVWREVCLEQNTQPGGERFQLKDFPGLAEHASYTVPGAVGTRVGGSF